MSWAWPLFKKAEIRHRNSTSLIISSFLLKIRDPNEEKATLCNSAYLFCWNRTSHKFFINSNSSFADMLDSDSNDGPALADPLETDIESDSCSFKDLNSVNLFCEYFRLLHSVITSSRLLISVRCRESNNLVFLTNSSVRPSLKSNWHRSYNNEGLSNSAFSSWVRARY